MNFLNSIYYKSLSALYNLNVDANGRTKNIIVDAIFKALVMGKQGLDEAKLEMALETASGYWLDVWGKTFGVYRVANEKDDHYRIRIIEEVIAPKNTIPALKRATSRYLDTYKNQYVDPTDIRIFEPWTELIILDTRGQIDDNGRLVSHDYWNHGVIDISLPDTSLITKDLIDYLNEIKAAGVKITFSISPVWGIVKDPNKDKNKYNVWLKIHQRFFIQIARANRAFGLLERQFLGIDDSSTGGIIDQSLLIEGPQKVFFEGINLTRSFYATGPIRRHFNSAVLSLNEYEYLDKENMTIGDAYKLENEVINGKREKEGRLTYLQGGLVIKRRKAATNNISYLPYTKVNSNKEGYLFPYDSILDYMSFDELRQYSGIMYITVEDFFYALSNPKVKENEKIDKALRDIKLDKMKESTRIESYQNRLLEIKQARI